MSIQQELQNQFQCCLQQIRQMLLEEKRELVVHYFWKLLETKARLQRLGENFNCLAYESCRRDLQSFHSELLTIYCQSFGVHLAEEILTCAQSVEANLVIFVEDSQTEETDELLREAQEELLGEIEENCLRVLIHRENIQLVHQEMTALFPAADFREVESVLCHMDRSMENLYLPPNVKERVKKYIQQHRVDINAMPWFQRPGIENIPVVLDYRYEQAEADVLADLALKHPISMPELTEISYRRGGIKLCAGIDDYELELNKNIQELEDLGDKPLWYFCNAIIEIRMVLVEEKICCEIFSKQEGLIIVRLQGDPMDIPQEDGYTYFVLGNVEKMNTPIQLEVFIDQKEQFSGLLWFKAQKEPDLNN